MASSSRNDFLDGIEAVRAGGGALTAATLPVAEMAPTARDDCRRAFRNILGKVEERSATKRDQLQTAAIDGRGDLW